VTFPQALFGATGKSSADKHAKKNPMATNVEDGAAARKTLALAKPAESNSPVLTATPPAVENKTAPAKPAAKTDSKTAETAVAEKPSEPVPSKVKPAKPAEVKESKPAAIPTVAAAGDSKSKSRYSLQLSSFQDKSEAETFAQKFEGERPYMVVSEIPGKGTWYRVRVGDYASAKDALVAKQSFERKHSVIAYVAQK
jgi:septal ring-binding cell division protein DamX